MAVKREDLQAASLLHFMAQGFIGEGASCIDATMGNGRDTEFLCRRAGKTGRVTAFDIQEKAVERTRERLAASGLDNARLVCESHERMSDYADPSSVDLIMFNLGYLPGGDHGICTHPESTLSALNQALVLLRPGGALCILVYSGGDTGPEEKEAVLKWAQKLDPKKYLALVTQYYNRPNDPPIPILITKLT